MFRSLWTRYDFTICAFWDFEEGADNHPLKGEAAMIRHEFHGPPAP
jgi:hypothetical protein